MQTELPSEPVALELSDEQLELFGTDAVAVLVPADNPLFATIEQVEAGVFPETPELFDVEDAQDLFQFLIIVKDGEARHALRLSAPGLLRGRTDLVPFFATDMANAGEVTIDHLVGHYAPQKLERSFSIETNFRIGPHLEPIRSADLAYMAMFMLQARRDADLVFAHLNEPAILSLERVGVRWAPLADDPNLRTPTVDVDGSTAFDDDYRPICILGRDPRHQDVIKSLEPFAPKLFIY